MSASAVIGQSNLTSGFVNGIPANDHGLNSPAATQIDTVDHRMFVADTNNNRVLVYNLDNSNNLTGQAASYVLGQPNFEASAGSTSRNTLNNPTGLAYDNVNHRLFVSEAQNDRIVIYDLNGGITNGMNASHVIGQPTFYGYSNTADRSHLFYPQGIYYDSSHSRLFVADTMHHRVLVFDLAGGITDGMNASNVLGQPDYTSNSSQVTQNGMAGPSGVSYDTANQRLFVPDLDNHRVLVFDLAGGITDGMNASNVLGQPDFTSNAYVSSTQNGLGNVVGVAYDTSSSRLFVADGSNCRVLIFDLSGGITDGMNASNVLGQPDFNQGYIRTTQNGFNSYAKVEFVADGRLLVSDQGNNRIVIYDTTSITDGMNASSVLGQSDYTSGFANEIPSPTDKGLHEPRSVSVDTVHHRLFAADTLNNRVLVFNLDSSNNPVDTTADYVIGQPDFTTNSCSYSQNSNCYPDKVEYDSTHNRLFVVNADYSVLVYDLSSGITNGMNASNVLGQSNFSNPVSHCDYTAGATQSGVCSIAGLAYDAGHDRLFVTDSYNYRVLVFDLAGGITDGMNASHVIGQPDFTTDTQHCSYNGNTSQSGLCYPQGLAYDSNHDRLFVSDSTNARVVTFDLAGGITDGMNASHVVGQVNFTTVSYDRTRNIMQSPVSLVFNPLNDQLFVADANNYRVLVFDLAGGITDGMDASDVIGQADYTSTATHCYYSLTDPPSADGFCSPYSMALASGDNRFYVADAPNNRIMLFNLAFQFTTKLLPNTTIGTAFNQKLSALYGNGVTTYTVTSGALPDGLTLDSASGMLSGTPGTPGTYGFTVQATDGQGATVSQALSLQVFTPVQITTTSLADGQTAANYDQTIATSNGQAPLSFSITAGSLPAGLSIDDSNGHITGMPSSVGDFNFTVTVSDANGTTDSKALSIHVTNGPLTIISNTLPNGIAGGAYAQTINVAGGQSPYSFSISSGSLPAGLSLDSSTGEIAGTPTEHGSFTFTIRVIDGSATSVAQSMSLIINEHVTGGYGASDVLGQTDGSGNLLWSQKSEYNGAGGPSRGGMSYPQGSVIDTLHHRLFISECGGIAPRIDEYDLNAQNVLIDNMPDHVLGQPNFTSSNSLYDASTFNSCATGLSYDAVHDRLFAPDDVWRKSRVLVFDLSGGITNGMAASHVLGQPDFTTGVNHCGNCGDALTRNGLSDTYGGSIYDASTNYLYVSDSGNARVLIFDLSGGITNGMDATHVIGQPDFTSWNRAVTKNGLGYAYGLALDSTHHRLFVADWGNAGRVMVYDTTNLHNGMDASFVLGEADFTSSNSASDNGDTPDAKSFGPTGLAYDSVHQRLFVEDDNANRILTFDVSTITNGENAIGVIGQPNFNSGNCNQGTSPWDSSAPSSQTSMCDTEGLSDFYDTGNNRLYVSDSSNNRVLMYDFAKLQDIPSHLSEGIAYTETLGAQTQGTTTYGVVTGSLPQGMTLNASNGILSGTPTKPGTYSFTVHLSDNNGASGTYSDDHSYSLVVAASQHAATSNSGATNKKVPEVAHVDKANSDNSVQAKDIDLDVQPLYTNGAGYSVTVPAGQVITFTSHDANGVNEHHTMVVDKIDVSNPADPTVTITVHSVAQTFTLHLNKQQLIDLDQDGRNDQIVLATAITKDTVTLKIINLMTSPAKTTATSHMTTPKRATYVSVWWYVAGGLILIGITPLYFWKRSRKSIG